MNDNQLENLLRRVRPIGPPPELRARVAASTARRPLRTWPWAAAAVAMLALTVGVHVAATRTHRETVREIGAAQAPVADLEAFRAALGEDESLLRHAELWAAEEQRSARSRENSNR